jgi:hypothetical protein
MTLPDWATEEQMTPAQLWEKRARIELKRAQDLEQRALAAEARANILDRQMVKAVGVDILDAVGAFCADQWPGDPVSEVEAMSGDEPPVWGVRCYVDGTSMKIWGVQLPGGFGVTGWK